MKQVALLIALLRAGILFAQTAIALEFGDGIKDNLSCQKNREIIYKQDFENGWDDWFSTDESSTEAGDLWHITEIDNAPSPYHSMILQNNLESYEPNMCNFLYSKSLLLPNRGKIMFDFMLRGGIADEDNFPNVDYFTIEIRNTLTDDWYHLVNPPIPSSFTELPETWTSADTNIPYLENDISLYQGLEVQFRIGFFSDGDEPFDEGMMIDDFIIYQIGNPPENVSATYLEEEEIVEITWEEPLSIPEGWYHHDNGVNAEAIADGMNFTIATRFNYNELPNGFLTKIRYYVMEPEITHTLKVWAGENAEYELYTEDVNNITNNGWNEFSLNPPVEIPLNQDLWFGIHFFQPYGYPASCDSGTAVVGYGDLIYNHATNEWLSLSEDFGFDCNWNLQGFIELNLARHSKSLFREAVEYRIYHRTEETSYELLYSTDANSFSYLHTEPLLGSYHFYRMTALYEDGESTFSDEAIIYIPPDYLHELQYDDGTSEAEYNVGTAKTMLVRFQAPEPNIIPTHVKFYLESVNQTPIIFVFYDSIELGTSNASMIGTYELSGNLIQEGWNYFLIPDGLYFDEGNFFAGILEMANSCSYGFDLDNQGSTYHNMNGVWEEEISGNVMIRILGTSSPAEEPDMIPLGDFAVTNFPNPFNPSTTIQFSSEQFEQNQQITVEIYNIKGQKIRQFNIHNSKLKINEIVWDGKNNENRPFSSGVYLYQIKSEAGILGSKKMLLMK